MMDSHPILVGGVVKCANASSCFMKHRVANSITRKPKVASNCKGLD